MMLKDYLPQDSKPFTDIRLINPPLKVRVHNFHNIDFYKGSLLGESKNELIGRLARNGITVGKTYEAIEVRGFGDVADITIKETDNGERRSFMSIIFEDAESENPDVIIDEIKDVAYWFLLKENMNNKKLQKLCYYAQAFSLALLDNPIASDADFEAWVHGPINKNLWDMFKQFGWSRFKLSDDARKKAKNRIKEVFRDDQISVLQAVWDTFGEYSADELESLTRKETPWLEQRQGLGEFENCNKVISAETMKHFYREIMSNAQDL